MSAWLIETLVASTLLMLLVLLVRERVAAMFGARIAYLLWLLPALRMVLPPLPESFGPAPIEQIPAMIDLSALTAAANVPAVAALPPIETGIDWMQLLLVIWLGGAATMMAWHLIAYRRFVRGALAEATDLPEMDRNGIEVCASKAVEGPFAAGLLVPTIVLPHDWRTRYTADELRLAMVHEAVHHRRGDLPVNFIALTLLALHWFNPIAWRAWRAFRADQELACDAVVLEGASHDERHSYASALVKSACKRTPAAACSLNPRNELKRRLRMMKVAREGGVSGRALAAAMVGGGLLLTASGGIAAETTAEIGKEVRVKVIAPAVKAVATTQVAAAVAPVAAAQAAEAAEAVQAADIDVEAIAAEAAESARQAVDREKIDKTVREALAEGAEARKTALAEARAERNEAMRAFRVSMADAEKARREALAEGVRTRVELARNARSFKVATVELGKLCKQHAVMMGDGSSGEHRAEVRVCGAGIDPAAINATQLKALIEVRKQLADMDGIKREHLAEALETIDGEIARLKAELH